MAFSNQVSFIANSVGCVMEYPRNAVSTWKAGIIIIVDM